MNQPMTGSAGTKTATVMAFVRAKIASRAFAAGDRLPSIRSLAASLAVSPATVVEAYDRLAAEGLVHARRGSGFYIAAMALPPMALAADAHRQERMVDPFWVSRQSLDADPAMPKPGCGWLPADWMPDVALRAAFRALARADARILTDYGTTQGAPVLRQRLLARFAGEGVELDAGQLLLAGSGTQALDLVCRLLLRPGDTVLVDDPCYFNFRALLRAHQVRVVGVPYTPIGPDLTHFEAVVAAERPRLYVTNAALHNPTGATLLPQVAHRLLNVAAAHSLTIVEDEIFADFEPEPSPRLAALDGLERVVRIGSFSKTLSASLRCGYIVARHDWIEALADLQLATGFGGPSPVAAEAIAHVLAGGGYRKHIAQLQLRLLRARRQVAGRLNALGIEPWLMPRGGFYLWCQLPQGVEAVAVAKAALARGIVLAPGNVFSVSGAASAFLRFNVAQCDAPQLWETLRDILGPSAGTAIIPT